MGGFQKLLCNSLKGSFTFGETFFPCRVDSKQIISTRCLSVCRSHTCPHSTGWSHSASVPLGNLQPFKEKSLILGLTLRVLAVRADDGAGFPQGSSVWRITRLEDRCNGNREKFACAKRTERKNLTMNPRD